MTRAEISAARQHLRIENLKWPVALREMPPDTWPSRPAGVARVLRSRRFLVQVYAPTPEGAVRLSVNRTEVTDEGRWRDEIAWDDLQRLKAEAGYADRWAVEVYPPDEHVVNVANMRHLWLLPERPPFGWLRGQGGGQ